MRGFVLILVALMIALPLAAEAPKPECKVLTSGDKFCKYGNRWRLENARAPEFSKGELFPMFETSMLIELDRYDLPPVDGPWRYYLRNGMIYRVSSQTSRVIEVVGRAHRR